ncbi:hypothetical protein PYR77_06995 [Acinetobacter soli]|nr:hypothetical protein [Acinetobacter soli]WEH92992.1 hypothetical protein PYR75_07425 [Acinetobacter soli]WEI01611.1 hypothetical protein PYR77_06995 [Acinetobacter soli]
MSGLFLFLLGGFIGFLIGRNSVKKTTDKEIRKPIKRTYTYNQRQFLKVMYESDAERIRELNLLSSSESVFLRLLKLEFGDNKVIVKSKRFFIIDDDKFPIAIFEYRDGVKQLHNIDKEDGLTVFLYKGILSSEKIREDARRIEELN